MTYNEIIAPYLIDFEKLEEGDSIWSMLHQDYITVNFVSKTKFAFEDNEGDQMFDKYKKINTKHLFFTSNPFENLQTIDPVESLKVEAETKGFMKLY